MAIAGKVAITLSNENDGKWSESVTYDRLTAVTHNNNLYISKKPSTNEEPTVTDEFWFLALEGFSGDDIEDIIDGTTQVGNAKTLDGHEAEYFFPKSGGYITGAEFGIGSSDSESGYTFGLKNAKRSITEQILPDGTYRIRDVKNDKAIIKSNADGTTTFEGTASGNLPLTGGRIKAENTEPLWIENTRNPYKAYIPFFGANGKSGSLGFSSKDEPSYVDSSGTKAYNLLHTGNKPTGTYTGNGDATGRTIATGGIGKVVAIWSKNGTVLVSPWGAICSYGATVTGLGGSDISTTNSGLYIRTTNNYVNESGIEYTYQVL